MYGAGEVIELYVGFRFPILVESSTAWLSVNTLIGGKLWLWREQHEIGGSISAPVQTCAVLFSAIDIVMYDVGAEGAAFPPAENSRDAKGFTQKMSQR